MRQDLGRKSVESSRSPACSVPRISVVVPVHNRSGSLGRLLSALGSQTLSCEQFEVLICDDGSSEDLGTVISRSVRETALHLVHLRQRKAGAWSARNLGLAHAKAEVVAFTDSDCVPDPDWLRLLDRAFADPAIDLVGGAVSFQRAEHISGRCINFLNTTSLGGAGATDPRTVLSMDYYPRAMNLAVRRDLALVAGGFPAYRHGEDLEFTHRIRTVLPFAAPRFIPEASVLHDERRSLSETVVEQFRRGVARIRLRRDHGLHEPVHAAPAVLVVTLIISAALLALRSPLVVVAAIPPAAYGAMLAIVAFQGAICLRDPRALVAVPAYAVAVHMGYGLGYLTAALGLVHPPIGFDSGAVPNVQSLSSAAIGFGLSDSDSQSEPQHVG